MRIAFFAVIASFLHGCSGDRCTANCIPQPGFYMDADADGFGDAGRPFECDQTCYYTFVGNADDCDDHDPQRNPDATDACVEGKPTGDLDCDGVDEAKVAVLPDVDGDGHAVRGASPTLVCRDVATSAEDTDGPTSDIPSGFVAASSPADDCDDQDASTHGGAAEVDADGVDQDCDGFEACPADADGDGYAVLVAREADGPGTCAGSVGLVWDPNARDCDDSARQVHPGAPERCADPEADRNCDGVLARDQASLATDQQALFVDRDGDGFGAGEAESVCAGEGWSARAGDCDDDDLQVNPAAPELCDSLDNDCDGLLNHDDPDGPPARTWYDDADGDGWGSPVGPRAACSQPPGPFVERAGDCDDQDRLRSPDAAEVCNALDDDCDGLVDPDDPSGPALRTWYADLDADGWGSDDAVSSCEAAVTDRVERAGDCDDLRAEVSPLGVESCADARSDRDCDGLIAADEPSAISDRVNTWPDADGDGAGDMRAPALLGCPTAGWVGDATDCDDADAAVRPGAPEVCNTRDDDCDGLTDAGDDDYQGARLRRFLDLDGDGFGDGDVEVCDAATLGTVGNGEDCDDARADVHPGAVDLPDDEVDTDCDGVELCSADADRDGYAALLVSTSLDCPFSAAAWSEDTEDCDDADPLVLPGATERCDDLMIDHDCDGLVALLDPDPRGGAVPVYRDVDGDGFGAGPGELRCPEPGFVARDGDCDDGDAAVNPGEAELCDGLDNDCDLVVDAGDPSYLGLPAQAWYADLDGDGVGSGSALQTCSGAPGPGWVPRGDDCDDRRADVSPSAPETCAEPGADRNCDTELARDHLELVPDAELLVPDLDSDGVGDAAAARTLACPGPGWSAVAADCDDARPAVRPGAVEVCNGDDDNCDGAVDEAGPGIVPEIWYVDLDGDLYGDAASPVVTCDPALTPGVVHDATDCDDLDGAVHPASTELCGGPDEDCSGVLDDVVAGATTPDWFVDGDGDGVGGGEPMWACVAPVDAVADGGDCEDGDPAIRPGMREVCDLADNDCNGLVDNDDPAAPMPGAVTPWYPDGDGDGHGTLEGVVLGCAGPSAPVGYAAAPDDCDDGDAAVSPRALERCNDQDDDCDGRVDSGDPDVSIDPLGAGADVLWLPDGDGDGFGVVVGARYACDEAPADHVALGGDCDDRAPGVHPGARETCAAPMVDRDCDGVVAAMSADPDGAVDLYHDRDEDGYGMAGGRSEHGCPVAGLSDESGDCDDLDPAVRPGAPELCNADDDDCDLLVDDGDPDLPADLPGVRTAWLDVDGDGFGNAAVERGFCAVVPPGFVEDDTDCADDDPAVSPGASEICNEADDNCDGLVDQEDPGVVLTAWYADTDRDGFGGGAPVLDCARPLGRSTDGSDCDDTNPRVSPGAPERCDRLDNDCNGLVDNADWRDGVSLVGATKLWNADLDGDGHGRRASGQQLACTSDPAPAGYSASDDDCDDGAAEVHPGAMEVCNAGVDDDCDGLTDSQDEDVFDSVAATTEWYADGDGDGFAGGELGVLACEDPPVGYVAPPTGAAFDCDDDDVTIHSGAVELCDDIDQDCDNGRTWHLNTASFDPAFGDPIDLSGCLVGAVDVPGLCTSGALDRVTPGEGTLHICQRSSDRYRLRIETGSSLEVIGHSEPGGSVLLTSAESDLIKHDWVIDANGALVLENLEIHDSGHMNVDQGWPAVYHSRSTSHSLTVRGCSFVDNGGDGPSHISYGGALQTNGNDVKIEDSTFSGNHSVSGAVRVWPSQLGQQPYSLIIRRTTFTDNHAKHGSGGGLNASGPSVVMEAVVFQDNSAPDGGRGGAAEIDISTNLSPITVALTDVDFINNLGRWGGGLHVIAPTIRLDSVTFEENVSDTQDGGGAHLAGRDIELTDVVAERNTGVVGSALYISPYLSDLSAVDIWDSSFSDNHATSNSTVRIALNAGSVARIENSQFRSNTSAGCSGLYVAGRTEIRDTTFADNVSGIGGALQFAPAGALTLERVDFERNTGAALLTSHEVQASLTECTFSDNTSGQGAAGIQVGYGNPNVTGGSLSVVNSSFLRNENTNPGLSGGAVFLVSNSSFGPLDATFEGVTFTGNSAEGPGGAMGAGDHVSLTLDSVIFASNQSLSGRGSAVSLNPAFARGPALSIEGTCQFDDNTPDDIWTSAQGPIDYANQTSCTGLTGCQP